MLKVKFLGNKGHLNKIQGLYLLTYKRQGFFFSRRGKRRKYTLYCVQCTSIIDGRLSTIDPSCTAWGPGWIIMGSIFKGREKEKCPEMCYIFVYFRSWQIWYFLFQELVYQLMLFFLLFFDRLILRFSSSIQPIRKDESVCLSPFPPLQNANRKW